MNNQMDIDTLREVNLKKYKMVVWSDEGISKYQIAKDLSVDKKEVTRVLDKFEDFGSVEVDLRKGHSGRPNIDFIFYFHILHTKTTYVILTSSLKNLTTTIVKR